MFNVTITFKVGPTIMEEDSQEIEIRRVVGPDQLTAVQEAAITLGALNVLIDKTRPRG